MTLNCNFLYVKDLEEPDKEIYTCESINFTNRFQNVQVNYVTNLHLMGKRDRDVKVFIIRDQICHFLPLKIETFFPHLQELEVDSSGLKKLFHENFEALGNLRMAIFPGNEIEFLPGDLFAYNHRLTHIDFSRNKIKNIGHDIFDTLYNLKYLVFDDNICFQGFGTSIGELHIVRDEVIKNCSNVGNKEAKRIVANVEEIRKHPEKLEEKKIEPTVTKDEKKIEEKWLEKQEPKFKQDFRQDGDEKRSKSRGNTKELSLKLITICFHLHIYAALFRERKIKF